MRVVLVRSGGLHGIRRTAELDTGELDRERGEELRRLVWEADLDHMGEPTMNLSADRFRYTLTIEEGTRQETLTFPEDRIPDRVRPLIDLLWRKTQEPAEPPGETTTA